MSNIYTGKGLEKPTSAIELFRGRNKRRIGIAWWDNAFTLDGHAFNHQLPPTERTRFEEVLTLIVGEVYRAGFDQAKREIRQTLGIDDKD